MGTTPSTQHLAGKKGAQQKSAAKETNTSEDVKDKSTPKEEAVETPPAVPKTTSPKHVPLAVHAGGAAGRVSTLGADDDSALPATPPPAKTGVFRGLKKMLKGKSKA